MKSIAIIPARGGSKRIIKKNTKLFFGKPIIAYSIETALKSQIYDEVMVSTDDVEIAEIAIKYGAKVPFLRSEKNSSDFATTVDVIFEVINWYKQNNINYELATCIYACAPFVNEQLLKNSFEIIDRQKADCVFPAISYSHPIQRAFTITENNLIKIIDHINPNSRTQDIEKSFHDAGMFYTFAVENILKTKSLRTNNTYAIEVNEINAHDIDNENDWKLAELKYKLFLDEKV